MLAVEWQVRQVAFASLPFVPLVPAAPVGPVAPVAPAAPVAPTLPVSLIYHDEKVPLPPELVIETTIDVPE